MPNDVQTAPAKAKTGIALYREDLNAMQPEFAKTLPAHLPAERFVRTTITALQNNPKIANCERQSVLSACMKAAQDGLILDGREAALVEFSGKAQYMPMVAGIMKLVRNSGQLSSLTAQVVCRNDQFSYNPALDLAPQHQPDWFGTRGDIIGVYAVAKLKDGSTVVEVMSREEVDAIRKRSRAANAGPWVSDWAEMARKTVIRRIAKYLPKSTDRDGDDRVFSAVERIDEDYDLDAAPATQTPAKRTKKAAEILASETVTFDNTTGEVIDGAGLVTEPAADDVM
jgi:recombination protein RecT